MPKVSVQTLILNTGHDEDTRLASVIMFNEIGFDSVEEALHNIGELLVKGYVEPDYIPKCCLNAKENNDRFCPRCGRKIPILDINEETLHGLARNFLEGTINDMGPWEDFEDSGWSIGSIICTRNFNPFTYPTAVVYECAARSIAYCYLGTTKKENTFDPNVWEEHLAGHVHLLDKDIKIYKD